MIGQDRLRIGLRHERHVQAELERRGWHVQPWGQGLLDDRVRQVLNERAPVVLWRWLPDLIAVRGDRVYLVDPKTDFRPDSPNFSIEISAIQAHRAMSCLGLRIVYVFGDMTCNSPENIRPVQWFMPDPGRTRIAANGSGTPFALVRKSEQIPFDACFGTPLEESA